MSSARAKGRGPGARARWSRVRGWAAPALLVLAGATGASEVPRPVCVPMPFEHWLANPDGDREVRLARLAELEAGIAGLAVREKRQLASLYWQGELHPAALVARDVDKARRWFAEAAADGDLMAMASSAELELANGDPFAGMMWAQIFVLHRRLWKAEADGEEYAADLVQRAFRKLPRGRYSTEHIDDTLNAFMDKYGARIEAGRRKALPGGDDEETGSDRGEERSCQVPASAQPPALRSRGGHVSRPSPSGAYPDEPGWASFRLRIDPSGKVTQAVVLESLPGPAFGRSLARTVRKIEFESVDPSSPPRDVILPISLRSVAGPRFRE